MPCGAARRGYVRRGGAVVRNAAQRNRTRAHAVRPVDRGTHQIRGTAGLQETPIRAMGESSGKGESAEISPAIRVDDGGLRKLRPARERRRITI